MKKKAKSKKKALARKPKAAIVRTVFTMAEKVQKLLIQGDLSSLTPEERITYYNEMCKSLGFNPYTVPFSYIAFKPFKDEEEDIDPLNPPPGAKLVLYLNASGAAQLRFNNRVGVIPGSRVVEMTDEFCSVTLSLRDKFGKTDVSTGVVYLYKSKKTQRGYEKYRLTGVQLANAIMKAETKAKRRGAMSICGLGFLDQTDLDNVRVVGGVTKEGRYYELEEGGQTWDGHGYTPAQQAVVDRKLGKGSPAVDSGVSPAGPGAGSPAGQPAPTFKDVGLVRITKSGEEGTAHVNLALKACRELEFLTDIVKNELKGSWIGSLSVWSIPLSGVPVVMSACKDFKIQGFAEKGLVKL